jgi:acyl-CoA thioester hydrolase
MPEKFEPRQYQFAYEVCPSDIDQAQHVNNASYCTIFEKARWALIQANGFDGPLLQQTTGIAPIVLELQIKFRKEMRLNQKIVVFTQYIDFRSRIAILEQAILGEHGTCATALCHMGLLDLQTRKMVLPTQEWLQALGLQEFAQAKDQGVSIVPATFRRTINA